MLNGGKFLTEVLSPLQINNIDNQLYTGLDIKLCFVGWFITPIGKEFEITCCVVIVLAYKGCKKSLEIALLHAFASGNLDRCACTAWLHISASKGIPKGRIVNDTINPTRPYVMSRTLLPGLGLAGLLGWEWKNDRLPTEALKCSHPLGPTGRERSTWSPAFRPHSN